MKRTKCGQILSPLVLLWITGSWSLTSTRARVKTEQIISGFVFVEKVVSSANPHVLRVGGNRCTCRKPSEKARTSKVHRSWNAQWFIHTKLFSDICLGQQPNIYSLTFQFCLHWNVMEEISIQKKKIFKKKLKLTWSGENGSVAVGDVKQ